MGGMPPIFFKYLSALMNAKIFSMAVLLSALASVSLAQANAGMPVAGLAPAARPVDAPRITAALAPDKTQALHGVTEPVPSSLRFLNHQGGWFNPFAFPGMTPPYDLRGWHARPAPNTK